MREQKEEAPVVHADFAERPLDAVLLLPAQQKEDDLGVELAQEAMDAMHVTADVRIRGEVSHGTLSRTEVEGTKYRSGLYDPAETRFNPHSLPGIQRAMSA